MAPACSGAAGSSFRRKVHIRRPVTAPRSPSLPISPAGRNLWHRRTTTQASRQRIFRHHLIDPTTSVPAWTGLVRATLAGASRPRRLRSRSLYGSGEQQRLARFGGILRVGIIAPSSESSQCSAPLIPRPSPRLESTQRGEVDDARHQPHPSGSFEVVNLVEPLHKRAPLLTSASSTARPVGRSARAPSPRLPQPSRAPRHARPRDGTRNLAGERHCGRRAPRSPMLGRLRRDRLKVRIQLLREDHEGAAVVTREDAEHDRAVEIDDHHRGTGRSRCAPLGRAVEPGEVCEHDHGPAPGRCVERAGDLGGARE